VSVALAPTTAAPSLATAPPAPSRRIAAARGPSLEEVVAEAARDPSRRIAAARGRSASPSRGRGRGRRTEDRVMRTGPRIAGRAPSPAAGPARARGPAAPVVAKTRLRLPAPRSVRTAMAATAATRTTEGESRTAGEEARTAEGSRGQLVRRQRQLVRRRGQLRTAGDTRRCCGSEVSALAWLEFKAEEGGRGEGLWWLAVWCREMRTLTASASEAG